MLNPLLPENHSDLSSKFPGFGVKIRPFTFVSKSEQGQKLGFGNINLTCSMILVPNKSPAQGYGKLIFSNCSLIGKLIHEAKGRKRNYIPPEADAQVDCSFAWNPSALQLSLGQHTFIWDS